MSLRQGYCPFQPEWIDAKLKTMVLLLGQGPTYDSDVGWALAQNGLQNHENSGRSKTIRSTIDSLTPGFE